MHTQLLYMRKIFNKHKPDAVSRVIANGVCVSYGCNMYFSEEIYERVARGDRRGPIHILTRADMKSEFVITRVITDMSPFVV